LTLLSACSITGFVGGTLNKPRAVTVGIATSALWAVEGEVGGEFIAAEKRWRSNISLNLRMPPLVNIETETILNEEGSKVGAYPIVGIGNLDGDFTLNAGLGIWGGDVAKNDAGDVARGVRVDYRHFFVRDNEDINRMYIGPEGYLLWLPVGD